MTFIRKKKIRNNYYYYLVKSVRTGPNSWKKYEKYIGKTLSKEKPEFAKEIKKEYDVIIIGAGPAGLFAAYELSKKNLKILVVEKGPDIKQRKKNIMSGIGGAGLYSDGKLNFTPVHGKTNLYEFLTKHQANSLINHIDYVFFHFGAPKESYPKNLKKVREIKNKAKKYGITLLLARQKHIGSDKLPLLIQKFVNHLKNKKVEFLTNTEVKEFLIKNNKAIGIITSNNKVINSKYIIACPGRSGSSWFLQQANKLNIPLKHRGIEIGVRVEIKATLMKHITDYIWDPTFFIKNKKTHDLTRTFCTCPNGFVVEEIYHGFNCVNGYCRKDKSSKNTNFALLTNIELTKPAEDTIAYGEEIGALSSTIGGGLPFIQRLVDLKHHRRSYWHRIRKSTIKPTLTHVTPGDLTMAIPHRVGYNIIESLKILNKLIPGINKDALLYGPELKFFSVRIKTNKNLETKIKNLYVAGDGVGLCGNIIGAAATGVIAARAISQKI